MKLIINVLYQGARIDAHYREIKNPKQSGAELWIDVTRAVHRIRQLEQPPERSSSGPNTTCGWEPSAANSEV